VINSAFAGEAERGDAPASTVLLPAASLGHANAMITLTVYQHVHPGMGRQAADRFAALLRV
jgi:integrase